MITLQHPLISGSTYAQARLCSGFPWLNRLVPRTENDWTRGGVLLHSVCEATITGKEVPVHPFEDYGDRYKAALLALAPEWIAEVRVGDDFVGGTVDAWSADKRIMVDLKTGHSRKVEPHDWQLKFYAAVGRDEGDGMLGVYQPHFYGGQVATYAYTEAELCDWQLDITATYRKVVDAPTLTVGSHCDTCKARQFCREQKPKKQPKPEKPTKVSGATSEVEW